MQLVRPDGSPIPPSNPPEMPELTVEDAIAYRREIASIPQGTAMKQETYMKIVEEGAEYVPVLLNALADSKLEHMEVANRLLYWMDTAIKLASEEQKEWLKDVRAVDLVRLGFDPEAS